MNNQLTSEYLAEIAKRHGVYAHIEETQGYAPWENKIAEQDRRDLLGHIEAIDISYDKKMHLLVMQVDSADWAAAELEAENKALRAATEKALRQLLFRPQIIAVLSGEDKGRALAHNDNIHETASSLNITLD